MDLRTSYAPEVERALVGLLWHQPDSLACVLRVLDPASHLFEPANRILLEAITTLYGHCGATDWATVIDYVRQSGQLEELGGVGRLEEIYSRPGYRSLMAYYVELLLEYALLRQPQPARPAYFLSGGRGVLWPNPNKANPQSPDLLGLSKVGEHSYSVSGWQVAGPAGRKELRLRYEFKADLKHGRSQQSNSR